MRCRRVLPWLATLAVAGSCHESASSHASAVADEYFYDCLRGPPGLPVYATDEAYRTFVEKIAATGLTKDDSQAPKLQTPAPGTTLSIASPGAISFSVETALRARPAAPPRDRAHQRARWAWVRDLLSIEGTAWAHCPNVTGPLYLVQLRAEGAQDPAYTALSSVSSFMPNAAVWKAKLQPLVGQKVTLTLALGVFSMGEIELGPFIATQDLSFTVGP